MALKKVATVEVYENKNEVRAYGFMTGDRSTPIMEVKFRHLWGEENLSKCKLRWIIVDDLGSLLVGEVPIEQDNTASIQLPNELFTGERRMKVQLTVASCDGSRILNLQQFTDLKVINNLATNEVVEPVYDVLINKLYDGDLTFILDNFNTLKAEYQKNNALLSEALNGMVANSRLTNNSITSDKLRIAEDSSKIKLINLSDEVIKALSGNATLRPTIEAKEITNEKLAPESVSSSKISGMKIHTENISNSLEPHKTFVTKICNDLTLERNEAIETVTSNQDGSINLTFKATMPSSFYDVISFNRKNGTFLMKSTSSTYAVLSFDKEKDQIYQVSLGGANITIAKRISKNSLQVVEQVELSVSSTYRNGIAISTDGENYVQIGIMKEGHFLKLHEIKRGQEGYADMFDNINIGFLYYKAFHDQTHAITKMVYMEESSDVGTFKSLGALGILADSYSNIDKFEKRFGIKVEKTDNTLSLLAEGSETYGNISHPEVYSMKFSTMSEAWIIIGSRGDGMVCLNCGNYNPARITTFYENRHELIESGTPLPENNGVILDYEVTRHENVINIKVDGRELTIDTDKYITRKSVALGLARPKTDVHINNLKVLSFPFANKTDVSEISKKVDELVLSTDVVQGLSAPNFESSPKVVTGNAKISYSESSNSVLLSRDNQSYLFGVYGGDFDSYLWDLQAGPLPNLNYNLGINSSKTKAYVYKRDVGSLLEVDLTTSTDPGYVILESGIGASIPTTIPSDITLKMELSADLQFNFTDSTGKVFANFDLGEKLKKHGITDFNRALGHQIPKTSAVSIINPRFVGKRENKKIAEIVIEMGDTVLSHERRIEANETTISKHSDQIAELQASGDGGGVDLIMFMGQSNMAGRGVASESPVVKIGTAWEYRAVSDPSKLNNVVEPFGVKENRSGINEGSKTGSMVSSFIINYNKSTDRKVVGVSASKGGTKISEWQMNGSLLPEAILRLNQAKEFLNKETIPIRNIYMAWCQGCSDGDAGTSVADYTSSFNAMFTEMKKNGVEKCFMIRIGNHRDDANKYNNIMKAQRELCEYSDEIILVSTRFDSMASEGLMKDAFHYKQAGYNFAGADAGSKAGLYVKNGIKPSFYDWEFNDVYIPKYGTKKQS